MKNGFQPSPAELADMIQEYVNSVLQSASNIDVITNKIPFPLLSAGYEEKLAAV